MANQFCTHCGEQLVPGDDFCGHCGWPVGSRDIPDPTTSGPEPGAPPAQASSKAGYAGGGNKGPWIVAGAIALIVVLLLGYLLFFSVDGSAPPGPVATATATVAATATAAPDDLKRADAHLHDNFALTMTGTDADIPGVEGSVFRTVWHFKPACTQGPCDVEVIKPKMDLVRNDASYTGEASESYGSTCNDEPVSSYIEVGLRVQDAAIRQQTWTATKVIGKLHMKLSQQGGCDEADATYKIHGRITSKSAAAGTGVPSIAQTSYPDFKRPSAAANYFFNAWDTKNRGEADWAATGAAVAFMWGVKHKDYELRCGGLGFLGGRNCALYLHKQKIPYIIYKLASGGTSGWYVSQAYYNAE